MFKPGEGGEKLMEEMKGKKKSCRKWIKEHKVGLIIVFIGTGVLIAAIHGMKKSASGKNLVEISDKLFEEIPKEEMVISFNDKDAIGNVVKKRPHEVGMYVRKLPEGYKASSKKKAEADLLGISLQPNQTLVDGYRTGEIAA